ncbi:MAG: DUF4446 family protein [Chloroflexi bacterium]|nr:DUF4446 family protein [Chloroflexota bacterium]
MVLDERALSLAVIALALAVIGLAVWVALLQRSEARLRRRLRTMLRDGDAGIDEVLERQLHRVDQLTGRMDALNALHRELDARGQRMLQRVGVVRFNPFSDTGGDQSFAIALLDTQGNGVVLSSLHGRADTRVFAKQVVQGRSRHQLSDEEQEAIRMALGPAH